MHTGNNWDKVKLNNRWKTIKKDYTAFVYLMSKSGWRWDPLSYTVVAPDEEAWLTIDKAYKPYRRKSFPHFDLVEAIVGDYTTKGTFAFSSQTTTPGSFAAFIEGDAGTQQDFEEDLEGDTEAPEVPEQGEGVGPSTQQSRRRRRQDSGA